MSTQSTLAAKYIRNYRKQDSGTIVYVYELSGKKDDIERYEAIQTTDKIRYDETSKKPLFFTVNFGGDDAKVVITPKDKVFIDLSEFQKAASLVAQFGGNFGQALAEESVRRIMDNKQQSTPVPQSGQGAPLDEV